MKQHLEYVEILRDGVMVEFSDGTRCFFSTAFLLSQVGSGSNHVFLGYDPTPTDDLNVSGILEALDLSALPIQ